VTQDSDDGRLSRVRDTVIRTLRCDIVTAEVVTALTSGGVPSILLKGPALARWLYEEGSSRPYVDADLLVPPSAWSKAERVLESLEFGLEGLATIPNDWPRAAHTWVRGDGGNVDLHHTLLGVGVPAEQLWDELFAITEPMSVAGTDVTVLRPPGLALVVALHAAKDGARVAKVRHDLGHAVERVPLSTWEEAANLAIRLQAIETFAAGIRMTPHGPVLAEKLGLPTHQPMAVTLRSGGARPLSVGLDWLINAETPPSGKARLVLRKFFPPPSYLRAWTPLARRGPLGLAAAYAWRVLWVTWRTGPAILAWSRARKRSR
jgi:hypothetical protein